MSHGASVPCRPRVDKRTTSGYRDRTSEIASPRTVSAIATATSTALDAAIPAISVSGAVTTARIASAASPSSREWDAPERLAQEEDLGEQEQRRPAEREDREAKRRVVAGVGDRELVSDRDSDQR